MAVEVRIGGGPLEPVTWPTGEEVAVRRPNLFAAKHWAQKVAPALGSGDETALIDALAEFVAKVCPSKTVEQISEECDLPFLMLVAGYSREQLEAAQEFVAAVLGKAPAGTAPAPASPPPMSSGTSPAASAEPLAAPCGA